MKNNGLKNAKAITLIALIVSIIVLLILAGVSIAVLTGENGLLNRATSAKQTHEEKTEEEKLKLGVLALATEYRSQTTHTYPKFSGFVESKKSELETEIGAPEDSIEVDVAKDTLMYRDKKYTLDSFGGIVDYKPTYASNDSKVGYYADLDGNGIIEVDKDGIIFADLAVGASGTGLGESYSLSALTSGLKNYEESTENHIGVFGAQKIIKVANGSTGLDRFYVMALQNSDEISPYWYYNAYGYSGKNLITSDEIGISSTTNKTVGRTNTEAIMDVYDKNTNDGGWGMKNSSIINTYGVGGSLISSKEQTDIFNIVIKQNNSQTKWFIPSKLEWSAFGDMLIDGKRVEEDYSNFGLALHYWSSSQFVDDLDYVWYANLYGNDFRYAQINSSGSYIGNGIHARLCTSF